MATAYRTPIFEISGIKEGSGIQLLDVNSRSLDLLVHQHASGITIVASLDAEGVTKLRDTLKSWFHGTLRMSTLARGREDEDMTLDISGIDHRGNEIHVVFPKNNQRKSVNSEDAHISVYNSDHGARLSVAFSALQVGKIIGGCDKWLEEAGSHQT